MLKNKILVTGSNGQLGNELRILAPQFSEFRFIFTDVAELDITSEAAIGEFMERESPAVIINCAAYTAVDKAEQEQELAFRINAGAAGILSRAASQYHALLIHISTDYVFDGKNYIPHKEDEPTNPVGTYARSKFEGEEMVREYATRAIILRTSWLYSEYGHNFVKTMMKLGMERDSLRVVFDQTGTPTYARDLAEVILHIIRQDPFTEGVEVFHYSNEGVVSWYDFAKAIMELSGIECRVLPIETHEYPTAAPRPFYSVFNKARIRSVFQIEIPYWRDSLKACIGRIRINEEVSKSV